ncbi:MAG: DoxX family protein [Myxococcota bacterium]
MAPKTIGFWIVTGLFAVALTGSGLADLVVADAIREAMGHLGYPEYFARILGFWKVAGVIAILVPGFPLVKEWAYAGFFFALTGAAASHLFAGDGLGGAVAPLVLLTLGAASWVLRSEARAVPAARVLAA